jgi:hypothetical protein
MRDPRGKPGFAADSIRTENTPAGFSGKLHNFPLLDIIQMACVARRDGRLMIRRRRESGEIVLKEGRIIHATTKMTIGEPALLEVLCWTKGNFEFVPINADQSALQTIFGGWEQVLMDAVRQRDELEHDSEGSSRSRGTSARQVPPTQASARQVPPMQASARQVPPMQAGELLQRIAKENQRERRKQVFNRAALMVSVSVLFGAVLWLSMNNDLCTSIWQVLINQKIPQTLGFQTGWKRLTPSKILIPAGTFIFQDNRQVDLPAFNIDSTEVTIWQYQEFLNAVGDDIKYDHPDQRVGKRHSNPSWEAYAKAAFSGTEFKGVRLNPNFPAVYLDWFDAYAFAKWQHRRLPTEMEWEKAGRGTDGRRYPWGDSFMAGAANIYSGAQKTAAWSEVGKYPRDISLSGVRDLVGNVSEWTASDDGSGSPVVRGGNFMSEDGQLTRRVLGLSPYTIDERIGFRTAGEAAER